VTFFVPNQRKSPAVGQPPTRSIYYLDDRAGGALNRRQPARKRNPLGYRERIILDGSAQVNEHPRARTRRRVLLPHLSQFKIPRPQRALAENKLTFQHQALLHRVMHMRRHARARLGAHAPTWKLSASAKSTNEAS